MKVKTKVLQNDSDSYELVHYRKSEKLTPGVAIQKECNYCKGGSRVKCESRTCPLNEKSASRLRRIRRHCLECAGSPGEVRACDGKVLSGVNGPHICYLHDYRFGRNPRRRGVGNKRPGHTFKIYPETPNSEPILGSRNDDR